MRCALPCGKDIYEYPCLLNFLGLSCCFNGEWVGFKPCKTNDDLRWTVLYKRQDEFSHQDIMKEEREYFDQQNSHASIGENNGIEIAREKANH